MNIALSASAGGERDFTVDELFFSTTDARGVITSGNEVFVRISGYPVEELVGKAHNVIRHPDMPKAAFRLVWERLQAGSTVAALVKNKAKDGCHYWVVALIAPSEKGYLSVRLKPTGAFFATVEKVYGRMLAAERAARDGGADLQATMAAGAAVLGESLRGLGFADYDAFMRVMLCEEMKSRDAALVRTGRSVVKELSVGATAAAEGDPVRARLVSIYRDARRAYGHLDQLYRRIDDFVAVNQALDKKSVFVNRLTGELRVASMNVALASSRLSGGGQGLGVISQHMGATSAEVAMVVNGLAANIAGLSERLRVVVFNLAAARLQLEMVLFFVRELISGEGDDGVMRQERRDLIHALHGAFAVTMRKASLALGEMGGGAHGLNSRSRDLERHMLSLQVAQLGGVVEGTRLELREGLMDIFEYIRQQIERTRAELSGLNEALERLAALAAETPAIARDIEGAATRIEGEIEAMLAA